jgi:DNA polymerase-4
MIIHIDMDAFFASVEQRDHPEYRGKPVIVGADPKNGEGRGVVSAASYEARKYGVHSAQPISQAYRFCPRAIFLPVRGKRYAEVSENIMRIFGEYTPFVEPVSLDEAFLDVSGTDRLFGNAETTGRKIKEEIYRQEKLTASVGIGPNKLIAKIASDLEKPDGFVLVKTKQVQSFLNPLPISTLWGVGKKAEEKLNSIGLRTIGDLSGVEEATLMELFGKMGALLFRYAKGIDDDPVIPFRDVKSVSNEITFARDEADRELLKNTLLKLSEKVAFRLRKNRLQGKTVVLKIRYSDFSTHVRHTTLKNPTCYESDIYKEAGLLFDRFVQTNRPVRLLGVGVIKLFAKDEGQIDLFQMEKEKFRKMSEAVDTIRFKYGEKVIRKGGYGNSMTNCE